MIIVIYGTTGELIKIGPLLGALERRGEPALTLCTGQQVEQIPAMLTSFGLSQPSMWLGQGRRRRDLRVLGDLPAWGAHVGRRFVRAHAALRGAIAADQRRSLVVVHGDTMTTVLGALMGRSLGIPVAHVEAGLRSGSWLNPFPEELNRHATSRLATIHLAPNAWAVDNLRRANVRGRIVDIGGNTVIDALRDFGQDVPTVAPSEPYGIASLHRQELLGQPRLLRMTLELLSEAAQRQPLLFVDHPITAAAISGAGLDGLLADVHRIPRQPYQAFIALLRRSQFLITDSGGSQEECAALGLPCLVHRRATERLEGLGESVVLSNMDLGVARGFLQEFRTFRRPPLEQASSPTARIVELLSEEGFLAGPG
jgi:UDP-N-acetylglucosamine 2-epimerase (non-hydrolysing)